VPRGVVKVIRGDVGGHGVDKAEWWPAIGLGDVWTDVW
jgi:hypothetical protein